MLDAAADLFAREGVSEVSLRQIADAADVHVALIRRYVGTRDELLREVLDDLSGQVAEQLTDRPLGADQLRSGLGDGTVDPGPGSLLPDRSGPVPGHGFNPVLALARVTGEAYGMDDEAARLRGAQIVASALGWRLFEDYVIGAGGLGDVPLQVLHDELTAMHRRPEQRRGRHRLTLRPELVPRPTPDRLSSSSSAWPPLDQRTGPAGWPISRRGSWPSPGELLVGEDALGVQLAELLELLDHGALIRRRSGAGGGGGGAGERRTGAAAGTPARGRRRSARRGRRTSRPGGAGPVR